MIDIAIHASPAIDWQGRYAHHAKVGLQRHGITARIVWNAQPVPCDVAIIMGPNMYQRIEQSGTPYLMFNRKLIGNDPNTAHNTVAISWDGFNGRGTFCVDEVSHKRLEKYINLGYGGELEDWKTDGEHILLCEQSNIGRATKFKTLKEFYTHVHTDCYATPNRVVYRDKPIGEDAIKPALVKIGFLNAKAVAVLNSTISIEALLAGYPVISYDEGDPVYSITGHSVSEILYPENRLELFQYMAHCQWNEAEIASGEFWAQLYPKRGIQLHEWRDNANL